tara:strand:- start:39998 stop:40447 length:450 start_codon:yes stop_codon:yes gene_type:complete
MANQNPQPEIYTTRHTFSGSATQGSSDVQTVYTNQASNEEVRIYGIMADISLAGDGSVARDAESDFDIHIQVGNSNIPSKAFDLGVITQKDDRRLDFPSPVLAMFNQPISVKVIYKGGANATGNTPAASTVVRVSLISELSLQTSRGYN